MNSDSGSFSTRFLEDVHYADVHGHRQSFVVLRVGFPDRCRFEIAFVFSEGQQVGAAQSSVFRELDGIRKVFGPLCRGSQQPLVLLIAQPADALVVRMEEFHFRNGIEIGVPALHQKIEDSLQHGETMVGS
jgi:hypothetical protein